MIEPNPIISTKKLTPFQVYQGYVALKQHFQNEKYDFINSNGKTRITEKSFERRRDKAFFHVLARQKFPLQYLLANFLVRDAWIGDLVKNEQSDQAYLAWRKRFQSFKYQFTQDLKKFNLDIESNFIIKNGQHPNILKLYLMKEIGPETATILIDFFRYSPYINRILHDDIVWQAERISLVKYVRLIQYDRSIVKSLILAQLNRKIHHEYDNTNNINNTTIRRIHT